MRTRRLSRVLLSTLVCGAAMLISVAHSTGRALEISDLTDLEGLPAGFARQSAFSPDSRSVVFSTVRPPSADSANRTGTPYANDLKSDIWIQESSGAPVYPLTHGELDGSGWIDPMWSPKGTRLLLKSVKDGVVTLWVWEKATRELRSVGNESVAGIAGDRWHCPEALWIDEARLVFCALPSGRRPLAFVPTARSAQEGWEKARAGVESSASVLTTGRSVAESPEDRESLVLLDVSSGVSKTLLQGGVRDFSLSPNKHWLAVLGFTVGAHLAFEARNRRSGEHDWLKILDLTGAQPLSERLHARDAFLGSWSLEGDEFAFWNFDDDRRFLPTLYRVKPGSRRIGVETTGLLDGSEDLAPIWTKSRDLVVKAAVSSSRLRTSRDARADWYLLRGRSVRNLNQSVASPPERLLLSGGGRSFAGISAGSLWRFDMKGQARRIADSLGENIEVVAADQAQSPPTILLGARELSGAMQYFSLKLDSGRLTRLPTPPMSAVQLAAHSTTGDALLFANSAQGTFIWRASAGEKAPELLRSTNTWLRDITATALKRVDYTGLNGEKLLGWLILPPDYHPGRRYPLVTWVYAGVVMGPRADEYQFGGAGAWWPHLLAARGYAVLLPSMPRKTRRSGLFDEKEDILLNLSDGVLPAIDKVIESGDADANRLFVGGHSFGGYSTYGLITQTTRFKAAVALDGFTDLVSFWGTAQPAFRYEDSALDMFNSIPLTETGQPAMLDPPWKDLGRYLRNSPISYVEQVNTPLLMVHGEFDPLPLSQAEEFFASLMRQGKVAELVRYWGESHWPSSPANMRDMWSRVFAWFDEYGDITRDSSGKLVFDGETVASRGSRPILTPESFQHWDALNARPAAERIAAH